MKSGGPPEEPLLFDLPVTGTDSPTATTVESDGGGVSPAGEESPATMADVPLLRGGIPAVGGRAAGGGEGATPSSPRIPASVGRRLAGGLADGVVHGAVLAVAVLGMALMEVEPELSQWPALALFLIVFSFLYTVVPLAFWGQTPGMAWLGLQARDDGERPLTFGQTAMRWLGGTLLSTVLLGLPVLLAVTGRSLADRVSRSHTYETGPAQ